MHTTATLDGSRIYRYRLGRYWDRTVKPVVFVMLNPSTADESSDDPTIRRCLGFAKLFGGGGIEVVNLFAFRSTKPEGLVSAPDPVGPENDRHIVEAASSGILVVAAWGASVPPAHRRRVVRVKELFRTEQIRVHCFGLTQSGHPKHPLYLKATAQLEEFRLSE